MPTLPVRKLTILLLITLLTIFTGLAGLLTGLSFHPQIDGHLDSWLQIGINWLYYLKNWG